MGRLEGQKHCIFTFFANFVKVSKKRGKTLIFHTFRETSCKKAQKRCFFALLRILYKVSRKTWKNTVFTFCGLSRTNLKKTLFFAFYENFVQSVSKDVKRHCFLTLICRTSRKNLKKMLFFRIFEKLCKYKLSRRTWKNTFFSHIFLGMSRKKHKELCFSHFLRTLYKIARITWKNTVFPHFLWDVAQKSQKTLFFTFFANFIQSVAKDVKNTVF